MKRLSKHKLTKIEEIISDIGSDLSAATSLVKFLDLALNDNLDITNMDLANLTVILKQKINTLNIKYGSLESIFDI